jgi:hypothetical protein
MVRKAEVKLKLIHIAMTHTSTFTSLRTRLELMQAAANEVISSVRLRDLLRAVLKTANYINHGCCDGAKCFSVKSLTAFASFKAGNASALHYLCLTFCDASFVSDLKQDLVDVFQAARENAGLQQQEVLAFKQQLAYTEGQLSVCSQGDSGSGDNGGIEEEARSQVVGLHASLSEEYAKLQEACESSTALVKDAQRFFDPTGSLMPGEEFFSYIADFVRLLGQTSSAVAQAPRRWQRFLSDWGVDPTGPVAADAQERAATQKPRTRLKRSLSSMY